MKGYDYNVRSRALTCTEALLDGALDMPKVGRICAEIADALEALRRGELSKEEFEAKKGALKRELPVLLPHATFKDGHRCDKNAILSGLSLFDIDHIPNPRGYWADNVEPIAEELGIVMAHVTPSTEGLRLIFRIPEGMGIEGAQRWMADMLDITDYDDKVKDPARCSFLVPRDYVLMLDKKGLLSSNTSVPCHAGRSEVEPKLLKMDLDPSTTAKASAQDDSAGALNFKSVPYSSIIARWFERTGGEPLPGERNTRLNALAFQLRHITDYNEAHLLEIMPRFGLDEEEMRATIHSACKKERSAMSGEFRLVLDDLKVPGYRLSSGKRARLEANSKEPLEKEKEEESEAEAEAPPPLPERLPRLIGLLLSRTPECYKPAVAHAIFPALGAHLCGVEFRYIDNVLHEATLMNVLMAGTGAGKSCIDEPIRFIMEDIEERDRENLQREREWKERNNMKGANHDREARTKGLVIQMVNPDMTNPAFVMRTKEAEGHFLYTKMNEIDMFDALRGSGRGGQQFQIMCLAFDPNNTYGQTRVGSMSVTENVQIRFNWNASTTIAKGRLYFRNVLVNGPVSRINFCTIPERPIGSPMPVYGSYDEGFRAALKPYIKHLTKAKGKIECAEAHELALRLTNECADFASQSQSRTYENLSFRANVIAWLKACVLYVANGCRWEPEFEDFVRWSLNYDLWCKMTFFGEDIERMANVSDRTGKRGPRNLLECLQAQFSLNDVIEVRKAAGLSPNAKQASIMLHNWMGRKYIEGNAKEGYRK